MKNAIDTSLPQSGVRNSSSNNQLSRDPPHHRLTSRDPNVHTQQQQQQMRYPASNAPLRDSPINIANRDGLEYNTFRHTSAPSPPIMQPSYNSPASSIQQQQHASYINSPTPAASVPARPLHSHNAIDSHLHQRLLQQQQQQQQQNARQRAESYLNHLPQTNQISDHAESNITSTNHMGVNVAGNAYNVVGNNSNNQYVGNTPRVVDVGGEQSSRFQGGSEVSIQQTQMQAGLVNNMQAMALASHMGMNQATQINANQQQHGQTTSSQSAMTSNPIHALPSNQLAVGVSSTSLGRSSNTIYASQEQVVTPSHPALSSQQLSSPSPSPLPNAGDNTSRKQSQPNLALSSNQIAALEQRIPAPISDDDLWSQQIQSLFFNLI